MSSVEAGEGTDDRSASLAQEGSVLDPQAFVGPGRELSAEGSGSARRGKGVPGRPLGSQGGRLMPAGTSM